MGFLHFAMAVFTAHYQSPKAAKNRVNGLFDFESDNRLGTNAIKSDARIAMLERFGNDSLSWIIDKIERKRVRGSQADGQMMLDMREPVVIPKRRRKKGY